MNALFSNAIEHGGDFHKEIRSNLNRANLLDIASGYVSEDILSEFEETFADIISRRGRVRILVGMAFYVGIAARTLSQLKKIDDMLCAKRNGSGIYVATGRRFHGKIYQVGTTPSSSQYYVGSSNFSRSGLMGNLECTLKIKDTETQGEIARYLKYLFDPENAAAIKKTVLVTPGSEEYLRRVTTQNLKDLERYDVKRIQINPRKGFDFPLGRLSEKSGLNVYFGKGRENKAGVVTPRKWYEVELISPVDLIRSPYYPKGDFTAYTDDGYVLRLYTGGDNMKNIRSRPTLTLLGEWIKSKLQNAKALELLDPVNEDTYKRYGTDKIEFFQLRPKEYFMRFLPKTSDLMKKDSAS